MALLLVVLGLIETVAKAAPMWSVLPFLLTLLSGSWWCYRWLGDRQLARRNRLVHTTLQAQHRPARTSPRKKPNSYTTERPYGLDTRS